MAKRLVVHSGPYDLDNLDTLSLSRDVCFSVFTDFTVWLESAGMIQ